MHLQPLPNHRRSMGIDLIQIKVVGSCPRHSLGIGAGKTIDFAALSPELKTQVGLGMKDGAIVASKERVNF